MIIKQLTLDQLHTYMKNNITTQIVRNTVSNNLHICFTMKIANEPFCIDESILKKYKNAKIIAKRIYN